jgi:outer membrane biosynthesis protein TonB
MPDPARIAQARALEVPVILQGAKTDPGTGRRELFNESATTILVFENGAVLNLRSKLIVGQPVFIHNLQNRKEMLCKVMEAPAEGEAGHTDLEFTTADPEFWTVDVPLSGPAARDPQGAAEKPDTHEQPESQGENALAMMSTTASTVTFLPAASQSEETSGPRREILVPAYEAVPETPDGPAAPAPPAAPEPPAFTAPSTPPVEPTGEQIDAALRQLSSLPHSPTEAADALPHPHDGAEPDHAQTEANLAALLARDARLAMYAAARETAAKEIGRTHDSQGPSEAAPGGDGASEGVVVPAKVPLMQRLTTGRNATIVQIAMSIVIVVALGIIWREERRVFGHQGNQPVSVAAQPKPNAQPAPQPQSPAPAPAVAATTPATTAPSSKTPEPTVKQPSSATAAKVAPATSAPVGSSRAGSAADAPRDSAAAPAETDRDAGDSATGAVQPKHRKTSGQGPLDMVPARILQQSQPALPPWAKYLDVDNIVTLDAVIDEKGNVTVEKVLSGPRPLQHAAEQAVQLWLFEPAQQGGKPTSSHMVLTVEFQRQP